MDLVYMMMGGMAVLAYQKYKKPVSKKIDKVTKGMNKKIDNMIGKD